MTSLPHPLSGPRNAHVDAAWVDLYGHMNMYYYVKLFDDLGHEILTDYGFGEPYTRKYGLGLFTVNAEIAYRRELLANAPVTVSLKIDKADEKRLWTSLEMHHAEQGYLAATMAQLAINVSLSTRRATPFPTDLGEVLVNYR